MMKRTHIFLVLALIVIITVKMSNGSRRRSSSSSSSSRRRSSAIRNTVRTRRIIDTRRSIRTRRIRLPRIDGQWSEWQGWSTCTRSCGGGTRSRSRSCTNPRPQNGGFSCSGTKYDTEKCNMKGCPGDGGYTEWGEWSPCDKLCGGGTRKRSRTCTNPVPTGRSCVEVGLGDAEDTASCNYNACPDVKELKKDIPHLIGNGTFDKNSVRSYIHKEFEAMGLDTVYIPLDKADKKIVPDHGNILGYLYGQESFSSMVKTETYVLAAPYSTIVGSMKQIIPGLTVLLEVARKFVAEAPTCERKRTMVFMAYDPVMSDKQCYNDTCSSFFYNANMTLHIAPNTNNEKFNVIILDSIGNLNPNQGSQTVNKDTVKSYPGLVNEVGTRNFTGDFLVANSQEGTEAGTLMRSIAGALKQEGISTLKTTNTSKVVNNTFASSAGKPYWAKNISTVVLTDTKDMRQWRPCLSCINRAALYDDDNFLYMGLVANGVKGSLHSLLRTTCVTLREQERQIVEMALNFNLPRNNLNNLPNKEKIRIFIKDHFVKYGAKVEIQNFTVPDQKETHGQNIIATFPGCSNDRSNKVLIYGAHYDGVASTHGFDDDGSGMTILLKVAEVMGKYARIRAFRHTLILVAFDYEEANLNFWGSKAFVKEYMPPFQYDVLGSMSIEVSFGYNDVNGTQIFSDGFETYFPDVFAQVKANGYKGDFFLTIGRPNDKDFAFETSTYMRNEGMKVLNVQLPAVVSTLGPTSSWPHPLDRFTTSDHSTFWDNGYVSLFNTATSEYRGHMQRCYHQMCDSPAQFSYKSYQFLAKHIRALIGMANENVGTCSAAGYTDWTPWSPIVCDGGCGIRERKRSCTSPPPTPPNQNCRQLGYGEPLQKEYCPYGWQEKCNGKNGNSGSTGNTTKMNKMSLVVLLLMAYILK